MADIAFLLLIFFLVTTTIASDKGLSFLLPPKNDEPVDVVLKERNIFKVLINSSDKLLVEDEPLEDVGAIKEMVKEFVMNNGRDDNLSESPTKAIVSIKANRGTSYEMYIGVLDNIQGAYYELHAAQAGMSVGDFRALRTNKPEERALSKKGREGIPMQISVAEPTN